MEQLTKEEFIEWFEKSHLPIRLMCTKVSEDTIIIQRVDNYKNNSGDDEKWK